VHPEGKSVTLPELHVVQFRGVMAWFV